jgi:hypothetical protein
MRRVALVGTSNSGEDAPFADPSYEIWGVSARAQYVTRADRWFELHRIEGEPRQWANNWRETVKTFSQDCELIMFYPEPELGPKVTTYPTERITARFGTYFMTSTFSWMMALAIDEMCPLNETWKPGEIALFGVDMEFGTEYREQRVGLRHFIDLARVLGIAVIRLANGGLSYEPIPYPFWQDDPLISKLDMRTERNQQNLANLDVGIRNTHIMIAENNAISAEIDRFQQEGYSIEGRQAELDKELKALTDTSRETSKEIVRREGILEEQKWLRDYLSP